MEIIIFLTRILDLFLKFENLNARVAELEKLAPRVKSLEEQNVITKEIIMGIRQTAQQIVEGQAAIIATLAQEEIELAAFATSLEELRLKVAEIDGAEEILLPIIAGLPDIGNRIGRLSDVVQGPDTIPPTVPGNLAAVAIDETNARVTFDPSTDNRGGVVTYELFDNGTSVGMVTSPFSVTGLLAGSTHLFSVRSKDAATPPNFSPVSPSVELVMPGVLVTP